MQTRSTRLKLVAFTVISALALGYALVHLLRVQNLLGHPDVVRAVFADPRGVYPLADVDLLGVHVGSVREVEPGPGTAATVVIELDRGVRVPAEVRAQVTSKSAIGEQSVQLTPIGSTATLMRDGATIPLSRTVSPPDLGALIGDVDALVGSLPLREVRTVLREGSTAAQDLPQDLGRILEDSDQLSGSAQRNADDLISLIDSAQTVLDTQVALGGQTRAYAESLAGLTTELRSLDPTLERILVRGVSAGREVSGLLQDNQAALPVLLNNLVSLTGLGGRHLSGIRKSLVVFPWTLEYNSQALRYCDKIDARTGDPVKSTCHYDEDGKPIWSAHVADVYKARGNAPYNPCTRGYESTKRYLPDGRPANGKGPRQARDAQPNFDIRCATAPTDPQSPNVRGFQNQRRGGGAANRPVPGWPLAMMDPESGVVVAPGGASLQLAGFLRPVPAGGRADLGWLMTHVLTEAGSIR